MNIPKFIAGTVFIAALGVSGSSAISLAAQANSNAAGSGSNAAASVKPIKKGFLLAKPTAIYNEPDTSSTVIEHVRGGIHVNVTGITGNWVQLSYTIVRPDIFPLRQPSE